MHTSHVCKVTNWPGMLHAEPPPHHLSQLQGKQRLDIPGRPNMWAIGNKERRCEAGHRQVLLDGIHAAAWMHHILNICAHVVRRWSSVLLVLWSATLTGTTQQPPCTVIRTMGPLLKTQKQLDSATTTKLMTAILSNLQNWVMQRYVLRALFAMLCGHRMGVRMSSPWLTRQRQLCISSQMQWETSQDLLNLQQYAQEIGCNRQ